MRRLRTIYARVVPRAIRNGLWRFRHWGLVGFVGQFGLVAGVRTFLQLRKNTGSCWVRVPQSRTPILVRRHCSDLDVFKKVFLLEEYLPPDISSPAFVIDGGANVGYAALYFANRYPDAQVVAVEPEGSNVDVLRQNTHAYPNVRVVTGALWPTSGRLRIVDDQASKWAFTVEPARSGEAGIDAVTIEQLCKEAGVETIGLLKLDIEGAEKPLFEARPTWVKHVGCLMIELHERRVPGCEGALRAAIAGEPFESYPQGENLVLVRARESR